MTECLAGYKLPLVLTVQQQVQSMEEENEILIFFLHIWKNESFKYTAEYFTSAWWLDSVTFRLRQDYRFSSITPHKRSSSVHNHFHYLNVTSTSIKLHTAEWTHNIFKSSKTALSCGNGNTAFLLTLNYNDSAVKIHLKHFLFNTQLGFVKCENLHSQRS